MILSWFASEAAARILPTLAGGSAATAALVAGVKLLGYDLATARKAIAGFALPMAGLMATHWAQNGFGHWPDWGTMAQYAIVALATAGGVFALPNVKR
jgi:hypothetical protein